MKFGLRTKYSMEGILFQVRRSNGQVAWQKFVRWGLYRRDPGGYERQAWEQAQKALLTR